MARTLCRVLGFVLLLAGAAGFAEPHLLGLHLTPIHNVIHVLSGLGLLYVGFAASLEAARGSSLVFGSVYFALGLLGFVAPGVVSTLLGHAPGLDARSLLPDNLLHLLLGGAFLLAGLAQPTHRTLSVTRPNP
jgi:hypothetical protein